MADRSLAGLLLISTSLSLLFCGYMFDPAFLAGTSPFWQDPHGAIFESWADMATALSGYQYFIRDHWHLPLFQVSRLGAPGGASIIYTDSTPIVALLGRAVFQLTGQPINPFGAWTALCFTGSALSMVLLVFRLGAASPAAAITATVFGLCAPALLSRWGHTTLMAQFEVTLALAFNLHAAKSVTPVPRLLWAFPLCALALLTHAYLLAMVAAIVLAAIAQALQDRRLPLLPGAVLLITLLGTMVLLQLIAGGIADIDTLSAIGFGAFPINLLSPIEPGWSGLGRFLGVDTDYPGETCAYLGAGVLLLLWLARRTLARQLRPSLHRHTWLWLALIACTAFAISNEVFLGRFHILHIPLPHSVLLIAGIFRASGRFAWPAVYLITALAVAEFAMARRDRAGLMLLLIAACLHGLDTARLRAAIDRTLHVPLVMPINPAAWKSAMPRHAFVRVVPAFSCLTKPPHPWSPLLIRGLMQIQLIAGNLNVPTNSFYSARDKPDCESPADLPRPGELTLLWLGDDAPPTPPPTSAPCTVAYDVAVCSARLTPEERQALLPDRSLSIVPDAGLR